MRSNTVSQNPSRAARAVRLALVSGAVVGIAAMFSCTEADNSPTAPLKKANTTEIGTAYDHAGRVTLCVDSASPPGVYKFTNSGFRADTAFDGHVDNANGGTGTDIENVPDGQEYQVAVGACQIVTERITADSLHEALNLADPLSGVNIMPTTIPSYAKYSHTDCVMDRLQQDKATYLVYPTPCDSSTFHVRAYMNIHHGVVVTYTFDPIPPPSECVLGYPDNSNLPRSKTVFNESQVLRAYGRTPGEVRLWYNDEHALLLGIRQVYLDLPKPTTDIWVDHSVAQMVGNPSSAIGSPGSSQPQYVLTGLEMLTGDGGAVDPFGRPVYPAVFVTDITTNPTSRAGDWQQGGAPYRPNEVYGTWKAGVLHLDYSATKLMARSFVLDDDPAKNHKNLGPGATPVPAGVSDEGFSSEVVWTIAGLGLNPSHNYRLQFMVHDGDQNKTGGDVGQACMNIGPSSLDKVVVN
jgi:hypothetical protein